LRQQHRDGKLYGDVRPLSIIMARGLLLAAVLLLAVQAGRAQDLSTLTIRVTLEVSGQAPIPVARHRLLVSENPPTAAPRLVVTGIDGSATLKLAPGSYIIESDRAVALNGTTYEWLETIEVSAGQDATLTLDTSNAETRSLGATPADAAGPDAVPLVENDPEFLLPKWQGSVATVWTALSRGSGFLVDTEAGLFIAPDRLVGTATSVEVQLTPTLKVTANVVPSDKKRDVAVLKVAASAVASLASVPLGCETSSALPVADGQEVFALGVPIRQSLAEMESGTISRLDPHRLGTTLYVERGSAGGPVFAEDGHLVGATVLAEGEETRNTRVQILRAADICEAMSAARSRLDETAVPSAAQLPVEPLPQLPTDALNAAVSGRAGNLNPYLVSSASFDIAFITPVHLYGVQYQADAVNRRAGQGASSPARREPVAVPPMLFFHNWMDYASDLLPVLYVRVTPKLSEGFWRTVARGAAYTQGVSLPSMARATTSFVRMKAYCGDTEVTPIHPFKIEQRLSETEAVDEGLYVFAADAFGPECAGVKLELYSAKAPDTPDVRTVDASTIEQVWQDFAPYRTAAP
jgi:S1-C subfamily serine protease